MRSLESIKGFGPVRLRALAARGIETALDLVETLPTGYKDTTRPLSPAQMTEGVSWKLMLLKWMRSGWNCPMTCFSFRFASNE